MKNGNSRKPQCACLPWLESVSLPWLALNSCLGFLRPLGCHLMYTTNPGPEGNRPQFLECPGDIVKTCSALL